MWVTRRWDWFVFIYSWKRHGVVVGHYQGRRFGLVSDWEFEYESESWIYYTLVFVFGFDFGLTPPSLTAPPPKKIGTRSEIFFSYSSKKKILHSTRPTDTSYNTCDCTTPKSLRVLFPIAVPSSRRKTSWIRTPQTMWMTSICDRV